MSDPYADFASPSTPVDAYSDFASHAPTAPQGVPGQDGLVWGADGGRDPNTGELVIAGKPMTANAPSQGLAAMSSALKGIPIVGPLLQRGAIDAGAQARQAITGDPADQTASAVQGDVARSTAAYPRTSTAAAIGGGVAATAPLIAAAPAVFGAEGGALTASHLSRGAASGAVMGGADDGVRSGGDATAIAKGAGLGALGGAAAPAIGAAVGRAIGPGELAAPTADALRAASGADYAAARGLGVHFTGDAVGDMAQGVQTKLNDRGILPILAPKTHAILDQLASPPAGATVPFGGLEAARRAFGFAAKDFTNPTEQNAAKSAISAIDDFFAAGDPRTVAVGTPGDVGKLASLAQGARANWAAGSRADQLAGVGEAADLSASAANSGQNIGNATRQRVKSVLLNPKKSAGFTDDELASLRGIVEGTPYQNSTRYMGNLFGGGGGLGGMVGSFIGAHALGPVGAAVAPGIGTVAKKLSNASTVSALDQIIGDTARRSPLYQQMMAAAPQSSASTYAPAAASTVPLLARLLQQQGAAQPDPAYR